MVPREMTLNDVPAAASGVAFWILGTKTLQVRLLGSRRSNQYHFFCVLLGCVPDSGFAVGGDTVLNVMRQDHLANEPGVEINRNSEANSCGSRGDPQLTAYVISPSRK